MLWLALICKPRSLYSLCSVPGVTPELGAFRHLVTSRGCAVLWSLALSGSSSLRFIAVSCLPPKVSTPPRPSSPSRPVQASVTLRLSCQPCCYPLTHRSVGGHSNPVVAASLLLPPCHLLSTTRARASSLLHAIGCGSLYCYCFAVPLLLLFRSLPASQLTEVMVGRGWVTSRAKV